MNLLGCDSLSIAPKYTSSRSTDLRNEQDKLSKRKDNGSAFDSVNVKATKVFDEGKRKMTLLVAKPMWEVGFLLQLVPWSKFKTVTPKWSLNSSNLNSLKNLASQLAKLSIYLHNHSVTSFLTFILVYVWPSSENGMRHFPRKHCIAGQLQEWVFSYF